ncbi:MAG: PAS domain S-box protein [Planctomycetes bacterium]|nr:PAS domain S-box protein [Planctomycetota bacterium]
MNNTARLKKPASASETETIALMTPDMSNFSGNVHGGHVLRLIDQIAYACASQYSGHYCVTRSVDRVNFRDPVRVGQLLSLKARVNFVGRTSMEVGVRAEARELLTGEAKHTNSCYLTMVALGEDGRPTEVPELVCETDEERRRFEEGSRRRKSMQLLNMVEQSEQRYQEVIECAAVPIILVDATSGQLRDANKAARELLGYSEAELQQKTVWDLHAPAEQESAKALWQEVGKRGFAEATLDHLTAGGDVLRLAVTSWLIPLPGRDLIQRVLRPLDS